MISGTTKVMLRRAASRLGVHHGGRWLNRDRLLICCYHSLRENDDPARHWLLVPRSQFLTQMQYLQQHYECLPLDEALGRLREGQLSKPTACVTFDDGYLSNRTIGQPVLQELGIPATVYVATAFIGTGAALWTTRLEYAFAQSRNGGADGAGALIDLRDFGLGRFRAGGAKAVEEARRLCLQLKDLPADRRRAAIAGAEEQLPNPVLPHSLSFMTWEDVSDLQRDGLVSIGAHTVHHEILSNLPDAEVEREISDSIRDVRSRVRYFANSFAYPNGRSGDFDDRCKTALRTEACDAAVTTIEGVNAPTTDAFALRRIVIGGDDDLEVFQLRMSRIFSATVDRRAPSEELDPTGPPVGTLEMPDAAERQRDISTEPSARQATATIRVAVLTCGPGGRQMAAALSRRASVQVVAVVSTPPLRARSWVKRIQQVHRYLGWKGVADMPTRKLVSAVASAAERFRPTTEAPHVPELKFNNFHDTDCLEELRRLTVDLFVVDGTYILRESVFSIPRLGSLNLHCGKLPDYRGAPPALWEIVNGESEVGVTIHGVTESLDAGPIYCQQVVPLERCPDQPIERYARELWTNVLRPTGVELMATAIEQIVRGVATPTPQPLASHPSYRRPDFRTLRELQRKVDARCGQRAR